MCVGAADSNNLLTSCSEHVSHWLTCSPRPLVCLRSTVLGLCVCLCRCCAAACCAASAVTRNSSPQQALPRWPPITHGSASRHAVGVWGALQSPGHSCCCAVCLALPAGCAQQPFSRVAEAKGQTGQTLHAAAAAAVSPLPQQLRQQRLCHRCCSRGSSSRSWRQGASCQGSARATFQVVRCPMDVHEAATVAGGTRTGLQAHIPPRPACRVAGLGAAAGGVRGPGEGL